MIVGLKFDNGEPGYYIRNRLDNTLDFDRHLWYLASKPSGIASMQSFFSRQSGLEFPGSWEIIVELDREYRAMGKQALFQFSPC